jgi:UDP-glucose 4-epimerase
MTNPETLESYRGRSVLITGGLGFIGSNLAHRLVEIGDVQVAIVDALLPEQGGNLYNIQTIRDQVELHQVNLCDDWAINHVVGGVDYIFNLAGSVSHVDSMQQPQRDLQLNCEAQLALLEACRHFNRM